jgi:hypothetical protein
MYVSRIFGHVSRHEIHKALQFKDSLPRTLVKMYLLVSKSGESASAPPLRPDPMPPTNRRPRTVDTSTHFCPHTDCDYRGWLGLNNLRANGHPSGGPWRQFQCLGCHGYFLETHGTIFYGKQAAVELIVRVLACLAEDFLPFVNPHLSHFLSHLHDRLTANPACIIARTLTQHGHQDTQESVANIA